MWTPMTERSLLRRRCVSTAWTDVDTLGAAEAIDFPPHQVTSPVWLQSMQNSKSQHFELSRSDCG